MEIKHQLTTSYKTSIPTTIEELYSRLNKILGLKINEFANLLGIKLIANNIKTKGYIGQMLEIYLGADGKNKSDVDFSFLNLELKTVPVDENFKPLESTFICHANLFANGDINFYHSSLYKKINNILFVLIKSAKGQAIAEKQIVGYFIFRPSKKQLEIIKQDYDELMEMVCNGQANDINAKIGTIIQMRPKCANGKALTKYINSTGEELLTRPRGFYMRRAFCAYLCAKMLQQTQNLENNSIY